MQSTLMGDQLRRRLLREVLPADAIAMLDNPNVPVSYVSELYTISTAGAQWGLLAALTDQSRNAAQVKALMQKLWLNGKAESDNFEKLIMLCLAKECMAVPGQLEVDDVVMALGSDVVTAEGKIMSNHTYQANPIRRPSMAWGYLNVLHLLHILGVWLTMDLSDDLYEGEVRTVEKAARVFITLLDR